MSKISRFTMLLFAARQRRSTACPGEPLDHPTLAGASQAWLDDLPIPAFSIDRNCTVHLLGRA
jgi:hypothetical protein